MQILGTINELDDIEDLKASLSKIDVDISNIEDIFENDAKTGKISLNGFDFYIDNNNQVLDYTGVSKVEMPEKSNSTAFNRDFGRIDIVFLNGTGYDVTSTPNRPSLDNTMVPVYYDETNSVWKVCSENDTNWYNYYAANVSKAGTIDGDSKLSKWANVMLTDEITVEKDGITYTTEQIKDLINGNNMNTIVGANVSTEGSMLVWIPRYAYKITYYNESSKTTVVGYSDSRGLVDTEGKTPVDIDDPKTSVNVHGTIENTDYEYYRTHPAFERDLNQGGWKKKTTGIWVGKFEATGTIDGVTTKSNTIALKSKSIGVLYDALKNSFKSKTTESHMMKNSEWGAIVYLAESKYGRNEALITKNENIDFYTGDGDYIENLDQSTTGNIYGIYDLVGGAYEYVASYIANNQNSEGYQFTSTDGLSTTNNNKIMSTEYATVYSYNDTSDTNIDNYKLSLNKVFGDAICETSTNGDLSTSWHSSYSYFMNNEDSFLRRGSGADGNSAGLFYFVSSAGTASIRCSSRAVCIVN